MTDLTMPALTMKRPVQKPLLWQTESFKKSADARYEQGRSADRRSWMRIMSSLCVEVDVEIKGSGDVEGWLRQYEFGELKFQHSSSRGPRHGYMRRLSHIDAAINNFYFVGMILSGEASIMQGCTVKLCPNDIFVVDSSCEYSFWVPEGHEVVYMKVPRARIDSRLEHYRHLHGSRIDGSKGYGIILSQLFRTSMSQAKVLGPDQANKTVEVMLNLLGSAVVSKEVEDNTYAELSSRNNTLRRVQSFIDEFLQDEQLSSQLVADHHQLSVRYLNRLFEREGLSLARWIRARRLERARQHLENPDMRGASVSTIAHDLGFRSISHFNRCFRQRFGCAPRSFRS